MSVKTYTVRGYTFTEEELRGANPYIGSDGDFKDGFEFMAIAFNEAKFQYRLDNMNDNDRRDAIAARDRFQRKMDSSGGPVMS